jgi:hypothetical protein
MGRISNNLRLIIQEFKGKDVNFTFIKVGFLQVAGIIFKKGRLCVELKKKLSARVLNSYKLK